MLVTEGYKGVTEPNPTTCTYVDPATDVKCKTGLRKKNACGYCATHCIFVTCELHRDAVMKRLAAKQRKDEKAAKLAANAVDDTAAKDTQAETTETVKDEPDQKRQASKSPEVSPANKQKGPHPRRGDD